MIHLNCRLCSSNKLFKFLDLGNQPPSDQFLEKDQLIEKTIFYPLEVFSCQKCGFIQLGYVVDPKILYQENYPYESSLTKTGKDHYYDFANSVVTRFGLSKGDYVIDVGSNIGVLLNGFKKLNIKVLGVEPAKNICLIANKNNIPTVNYFFDKKAISFIKKKRIIPKIITATNVFAHVHNLNEFILNIKEVLDKKKGVLIIESPHFLNLLKKLEYDTIYHEHLSYLTITPLISFFKKFSMEIFRVEKKDIHGGSIRIFVSFKKNFTVHSSVNRIIDLESRYKINSKKTLLNFRSDVRINRFRLIQLLTKIKLNNKTIVAVSAPAKGMTLLNYAKIDFDYLDFATEKSKLKQGLYTPGSKIPVYSDSQILKKKPDYALLLAWNFSKEIIANNLSYLKNGGKFIIPIPKIKIITYKNYHEKD
jgi:hypothetical protein